MPEIWAIIPVKPLHIGKTRLAHILSVNERAELIQRCFTHMLSVLNQVPIVRGSWVISSDRAVLALAQAQGAQILAEDEPHGLNQAVQVGTITAVQAGADGVLILPADLPFIQTSDIETMMSSLISTHGNGRSQLVICPDEKQKGTNALLLAPATPFTFHYGPDSFSQHLTVAQQQQRAYTIINTPGLQFDLDTETDWLKYQQLALDKTYI